MILHFFRCLGCGSLMQCSASDDIYDENDQDPCPLCEGNNWTYFTRTVEDVH